MKPLPSGSEEQRSRPRAAGRAPRSGTATWRARERLAPGGGVRQGGGARGGASAADGRGHRARLQHVRPYSEFLTDLVNNTVPRYNFIVPDLCHDMHENISCSQSNRILFGDTWLSTEVPKILASQAYLNNGALFITWHEGASGDGPIGMILLSPKAKVGYQNTIPYDHSSTLRTVQEIFGVTTPMLGGAA